MIPFAERSGDLGLLTFAVAEQLYALPIDSVLEVAEAAAPCGVPTLPRADGAVMNWHGEALPLLSARRLVEQGDSAAAAQPVDALAREHVLVLSERGGEAPCLGLPIDAVLGIVVGARGAARPAGEIVVERRPLDGRVVSVLDPRRLMARAREVIEDMAAGHGSSRGE